MVWQTGETINGDTYRILSKLTERGFGITYRAENLQTGLEVVIKAPNDRLMDDPKYCEFLQKFHREINVLCEFEVEKLRHPHIVRIYDSFQAGNLPCLVSEFVQGQTLQQKGKVPEQDALTYIAQIGSAILAIHGRGKVHRDIHPANIVITPENQAVLVDFGLAAEIMPMIVNALDTDSRKAYEAPWLRRGSSDPFLDIYALSGTLYFALTGKDPHWQNSAIQFKQITNPLIDQVIQVGIGVQGDERPKLQTWLKSLTNTPQNNQVQINDLPNLPWKQEPLWEILCLPFAIGTLTGYLWQTIDVHYGFSLSFYLLTENFRIKKNDVFTRAIEEKFGDWASIDTVGIAISGLTVGLIVGGVGYVLMRILLPKSGLSWVWNIAFAGTISVIGVVIGFMADIVVWVIFWLTTMAIAWYSGLTWIVAGAWVIVWTFTGAWVRTETWAWVTAFAGAVALTGAWAGAEKELKKLKAYSVRKCTLILTSSWIAGSTLGWLLYYIFPLFYIELPSGL
jgi:serine/threonine-protein kinase